ncbi:MAG TPA: histidine phosphatase family protein [Gemmatimonas sp.]|nr:histidine phosphatase family protein [Gemmatimonas sp.]
MTAISRFVPSRPRSLVRSRTAAAMFGVALIGLGSATPLHAQSTEGPSLVVLVRHGEKAPEPAADPVLSAAGQERAKALLEAMSGSVPTAVIVSATTRTSSTAAPLAAKFGITPKTISLAGGTATHVQAVADAVRGSRGVVVVVGHSNTIPAIVKALGGPALPDLCDASYSTMFLLQPGQDGKPAQVVRAQYGVADPPAAATCGTMRSP